MMLHTQKTLDTPYCLNLWAFFAGVGVPITAKNAHKGLGSIPVNELDIVGKSFVGWVEARLYAP